MPLKLIPQEEQSERKKEEKPETPSEKPRRTLKLAEVEPKETKPKRGAKTLHVSSKYTSPIYIPPDKEIRSGVPVSPFDPCCGKLCKILNDEIEDKKRFLESTIASGAGRELYESGIYLTTKYRIDALEGHRQDLKDNESCRCTEETGAVSIMLPLMQAKSKAETEYIPKGPPILKGFKTETLRSIHREEKPITPTENACCPKSCKILNDEINRHDKLLDKIELRGGPKAYANPRYEALTHRTLSLQDYRIELLKKDSCKCIE